MAVIQASSREAASFGHELGEGLDVSCTAASSGQLAVIAASLRVLPLRRCPGPVMIQAVTGGPLGG